MPVVCFSFSTNNVYLSVYFRLVDDNHHLVMAAAAVVVVAVDDRSLNRHKQTIKMIKNERNEKFKCQLWQKSLFFSNYILKRPLLNG